VNLKTKILAASVAAVAVTGGVGATWASADTPSPSPSATSSASPGQQADQTRTNKAKADKKHRSLQQRALYGEVTLGGKKTRVVDFQRGTVAKVSATSVTVKSKDGFTANYQVTSTTKIRKAKEASTISAVEVNDKVRVVATKDGATLTAKKIMDRVKK
jgi:hypothetical protein